MDIIDNISYDHRDGKKGLFMAWLNRNFHLNKKVKSKKILQFEFEVWGLYDLNMFRPIAERLKAKGHKCSFYLVDEKDVGKCFNRERYEKFVKPLNLPEFTHKRNFAADVYVTLQPPHPGYKGHKIKINYGTNFIQQPSFNCHKSTLQELDGFLVQGYYSKRKAMEQGFSKKRIFCLHGAIQYDSHLQGLLKFNKKDFIKRYNLVQEKKTIVYLTTWDEHCGIDLFYKPLKKLSENYNIFIKPHGSIYTTDSTSEDGYFEREDPERWVTYRFNQRARIKKA